MSDLDNARAQAEARRSVPSMSSADRARLWAGMNRYLAAEAEHARKTSARDDEFPEPSSSSQNRTPEPQDPA